MTATYRIDAPTADLTVTVECADGTPRYAVTYGGRELVAPSVLGLDLGDDLAGDFEVLADARASHDGTWEPVWGANATVRNRYEQLRLELRDASGARLDVVFRVHDDGLGFRYVLPEQDGLDEFAIERERTEFRFADDFTAWWIPAEDTGPRPCSWVDTYEKVYSETPLSEMPRVHTPVTVEAGNAYLALHEAELVDYADMEPTPVADADHAFRAGLVALPDGRKVRAETPHRSPWRALIVGDDPGDLVESHLIQNLNPPCELDDTSWIRPGKYVGVWWEMHKGAADWAYGPDVGATTENVKRYVDFAAEHDIPYVLAEGWNVGWGPDTGPPDFTTAHDRFDLDEVLAYCEERGVEFIGHAETFADVESFEAQLAETFEFYERRGIPAVKTGYAGDVSDRHRHDQRMVNHHRRVVELAAEHGVMLDVHEPIKPTGERRPFPHFMTREGVRGMEINANPRLGGNPPAHTVTLPFTRMVAGPLDYTPGIFAIRWDPSDDGTRVNSTRARQLALYVLFLSGLQMVADLPEHYEGETGLSFVADVPVSWDETTVVGAEIGDYVAIARRRGDEWYLGCGTDDRQRTLSIPLEFLDEGTYVAEVYADAPETDLDTNPEALSVDAVLVDADTTLVAPMAAGGGQAVRFRPATDADVSSLPAYDRDGIETRGQVHPV